MLGISFSKLPKNKRFQYKSVWYDAKKEELHERVDLAKSKYHRTTTSKDEDVVSATKQRIHDTFDRKYRRNPVAFNPSNSLYSVKVLALTIIIGIMFYAAWESSLLDKFMTFIVNGR